MRQGVGCLSPCHRCSGGTGRFGPGVCLESTNLYKFPRMEERTTAGDEAGCRVVRRGGSQRARLGSRGSRPNRSGCRSRGRAGGSLGAIGRGRRFDPTTKSKAMSSLPTSSKRATGRLGESRLKGGSRVLSEEGQTREGNESARRTKAARKWHSGDPGRVVPRSALVQVPSALVLGLAGGAGVAASREIEWLFFPGSPPRRHKRAVLSSLQGPLSNPVGAVPHDSETTKFQWARRARSSYPPGLLRCDGPKRRRRLSSFLLGYCLSLVVVRSASWRIGDSGIFNPVGVDNNVLLSRGRWIGTGDTRSGSRPK